jgi:hypothetical protein
MSGLDSLHRHAYRARKSRARKNEIAEPLQARVAAVDEDVGRHQIEVTRVLDGIAQSVIAIAAVDAGCAVNLRDRRFLRDQPIVKLADMDD